MEETHHWKFSEEEERKEEEVLLFSFVWSGRTGQGWVEGGKRGGSAKSKHSPCVQPAGSHCGRPRSSEEGTTEKAGLFLRLCDLHSMTAPLRRVSLQFCVHF